jgi:DNA-binding NarL/FixJ family response regulator
MKRITLLLTEDHAFVREGFRKMLELEPDFEIVGEAQDGRHAIAMTLELCPDLVRWNCAPIWY